MVVAHYGAFHLRPGNGFLHQNLAVIAEGFLHGGGQLFGIAGPADAHRGPQVHRLDKDRPAQFGFHFGGQLGGGGNLSPVNGKAPGGGNAGRSK